MQQQITPLQKGAFQAAICVFNSKYIHSSLAPWCLLAGVRAYGTAGVQAHVVESTINRPVQHMLDQLLALKPQAVTLSCYIWNITQVQQLAAQLRSTLPHTAIILGGPEVSYNARQVLAENAAVDYIISGEGERPLAQLLDALAQKKSPEQIEAMAIDGLCLRTQNGILVAPPNTPQDEPPSPYLPEYFAALQGRIAYLETSRGCPYSCAFCLSGRCGTVRFYSMERAKAEILLLANSGAKTVKLVDRTFNCNRARAKELWRFVIENYGTKIPGDVCFHFEIAGDICDEETLQLLATAPVGSIQLEIGLQSFNPVTLQAIRRKTDILRLQQNIRSLLAPGNIHVHIDLIAGLPYEDYDSFANSFNIAYALQPHMLQLGFLKLLHGALLRQTAEQNGCVYSQTPPYEMSHGKWITKAQMQSLHQTEDALERLYNAGRFRRTVAYVLGVCGVTPFTLYSGIGGFVAKQTTVEKIALDDYTALVWDYFSALEQVDKAALRDAMVCDRLSTINTGRLPDCLKVSDIRLKQAVHALGLLPQHRLKKGTKRGAALLYGQNALVYADYNTEKNHVTTQYKLHTLPLEQLLSSAQEEEK
ncbi:MAG: DUF4080 domain-containing protein [Oscillospiraceae bacterium]|nr:DUF4080 domain-containing protein [Oscillospiraceae bacterium]